MDINNKISLNRTKKKALRLCADIFRWIFLISFSYILLYPIIFMVANAVKTQSDVMNPAVNWISHSPSLYSFKLAFEGMQYMKALKNTMIFSVASALIQVFTCPYPDNIGPGYSSYNAADLQFQAFGFSRNTEPHRKGCRQRAETQCYRFRLVLLSPSDIRCRAEKRNTDVYLYPIL